VRKPPVAAAAALAGLGWLYSNGQFPKAQGFGRSFIGTPGRGRLLALTYDDGPNTTATPALLDVLGSHDARATFFTIGRYAEEQPELLREVASRGHAIGNHTYSHLTMPFHTAATVREELRTTTEAIERSGVEMARVQGRRLMRPPYGRRRPGTLRLLRADGYVPIMWSVTLWDWRRGVTADWIVKKAERRIRGGDVILLHDGSDLVMGSDRSQTVEATERILARWKADGYEFVTIPEMVERTGFVYP
jgi:peptidoglycan-N-acetylglucosamine deacetylase